MSRIESESAELAARSFRVVGTIVFFFQFLYLIADSVRFQPYLHLDLPLYVINCIDGLLAIMITRTPWFSRYWKPLALAMVGMLDVTGTIMDSVSGTPTPNFYTIITYAFGCATFLPWGAIWQAAINLLCLTNFIIVTLNSRVDDRFAFYQWIALAAVLILSEFCAAFLHQYRHKLFGQVEEIADAYRKIQNLNAVLEDKVDQRTRQLSQSNHELEASLRRLEQAYQKLQQSQQSLTQAEQMAAFGRLAAGMAHEMNTPLGASMTSLKLLHDLVEEYKAAAADPDFSAGDHRQIASEMDDFVSATRTWVEKAATHIRSLKLYTAAVQRSEDNHFSVLQTIEDVRLLLSHRFRLSLTKLIVTCSASDPMLYGDAGKLGQVLTNLISNAIDAHKLAGRHESEIRVEVRDDGDVLEIRVIDQGCGISPEHLDRIFDEFFSTKTLGEGTGLGLSIARNIISRFFEGTIQVESILGQGSVFSIRLPSRAPSYARISRLKSSSFIRISRCRPFSS
jgi:signal transduction histidine kinase